MNVLPSARRIFIPQWDNITSLRTLVNIKQPARPLWYAAPQRPTMLLRLITFGYKPGLKSDNCLRPIGPETAKIKSLSNKMNTF